ncbi:MAG TPA: LuxR C-terminal-related transcriptional regulator [Rhizobacter sp.]|nr:LuxR C-terminal-related transcriptional regulator [Rhizobacter sp.]
MIQMLERSAHPPDPTYTWAPNLFAAMVDEVDYPMLLVTCGMQLMYANKAARRCLEGLRIFRLVAGGLRLLRSADQSAVSRAVEAACLRGLRGYVQVAREPDGGDALAVVPQRGRDGIDAALLMLSRAVVCDKLPMAAYARNHGLTASEARVLEALCAGHSVAAIARVHGVTVSTVRTQVSSLRAKTGTKSIDDLLLKVAVLPPLTHALQAGCLQAA